MRVKMSWVWAILLGALLVALVSWERLQRKHEETKRTSTQQLWNRRALNPLVSADRILVVITSGHWRRSLDLAAVALETAFLPQRVWVAVQAPPGDLAEAELELRDRLSVLSRRVTLVPLAAEVRLGGASVVRAALCDHPTLPACRYLLCLSDRVRVHPSWDQRLLESLRAAYERGAHLVSEWPLGGGGEPSTFPALLAAQTFRAGCPVLHPVRFQRAHGNVYPTPGVCTECTFGERATLGPLLAFPTPLVTQAEDDFLASVMAFRNGASCTTLLQSAVHRTEAGSEGAAEGEEEGAGAGACGDVMRKLKERLLRTLVLGTPFKGQEQQQPRIMTDAGVTHEYVRAYLSSLSVDIVLQHASGRSLLGLWGATGTTRTEVLDKFGSVERYRQLRTELTY